MSKEYHYIVGFKNEFDKDLNSKLKLRFFLDYDSNNVDNIDDVNILKKNNLFNCNERDILEYAKKLNVKDLIHEYNMISLISSIENTLNFHFITDFPMTREEVEIFVLNTKKEDLKKYKINL